MSASEISSVGQALAIALSVQREGRLEAAAAIYRELLAVDPDNAEVVLLLAICMYDQREHGSAEQLLRRGLAKRPSDHRLHVVLGRVLKAQGRFGDAVECYQQALRLQPSGANGVSLDIMVSLGIAQRHAGRAEEAITVLRAAANLLPSRADVLVNLASCLYQAGEYDEAITILERAIVLQPKLAEAHCNLGRALIGLSRYEQAEAALNRAIQLRPAYAEALVFLGIVTEAKGDLDQAGRYFAAAIEADRDNADAYRGLGTTLYNRSRLQQALECFQTMAQRHPTNPEAALWSGLVLREQGQITAAVEAFDRAIGLNPGAVEPHAQKGFTLALAGEYSHAIRSLDEALRQAPAHAPLMNLQGNLALLAGNVSAATDWYRRAVEADPELDDAQGNALFSLNYDERVAAESILQAHQAWGERVANVQSASPRPLSSPRAERLRVGFVSPDFNQHSVAYFVEPLVAGLGCEGFDVFCYYNARRVDSTTQRLSGYATRWTSIAGIGDGPAADLVRRDGLHVLIDLAGHTAGNRLRMFARNPAPQQATYLGYPTTVGLPHIRYRITDGIVDPEQAAPMSAEIPVRLPNSYFCFRPTSEAPEVGPLPLRKNGRITFGSFNNLAKVSPGTLRLWAAVLDAVPESTVILKNRSLIDGTLSEEIARRFALAGGDTRRLVLRPWSPETRSHLEAYNDIDVALDTFPYNGATTTCEALWMGVPVVTRSGSTHASRMGASILGAAGYPALVANTEQAYVERCVELAGDAKALAGFREQARPQLRRSALMDERSFVQAFAHALRGLCSIGGREG